MSEENKNQLKDNNEKRSENISKEETEELHPFPTIEKENMEDLKEKSKLIKVKNSNIEISSEWETFPLESSSEFTKLSTSLTLILPI